MTQVTALERSVIRNIAEVKGYRPLNVSSTYCLTKEIARGSETVKVNQVNAVILNLKKKALVAQPTTQSVRLTDDGFEVYKREFATENSDVLEALRLESNLELTKVKPMSVDEIRITNELISIRSAALKLLSKMQ